jgi:hypothetical protein
VDAHPSRGDRRGFASLRSVRRPTFIMIVVLFALIVGAAIYQISLASRDRAPLPGPVSPNELPSTSPSASP